MKSNKMALIIFWIIAVGFIVGAIFLIHWIWHLDIPLWAKLLLTFR